jgi:hypothetical protein
MNADQYVKYQAFFRRLDTDGNFVGWIAHDTTHVDQMPEQHAGKHDYARDASWTLAEAVTFWAHGLGLSKLPDPLPYVKDKPANATDMGEVEVPYTPERR